MTTTETIALADFQRVEVRAGTIVAAEPFPEARRPAYKLRVDFGSDIGVRQTSAQITVHYTCEQLLGSQVAAVVNFPTKQIGKFMSEVLVLGVPDAVGEVVLLAPDQDVPLGGQRGRACDVPDQRPDPGERDRQGEPEGPIDEAGIALQARVVDEIPDEPDEPRKSTAATPHG